MKTEQRKNQMMQNKENDIYFSVTDLSWCAEEVIQDILDTDNIT